MDIIIRKIEASDNPFIENIIKSVFIELHLPLTGTAYADGATGNMYRAYQNKGDSYFVASENGTILGGGGIKAINTTTGIVCELQKMYLSPGARNKGIGKLLLQKCLDFAKTAGYEHCYLETLPQLKTAILLYEKNGFKHLQKPLGNTGHSTCNVWMAKDLTDDYKRLT